MVSLVSREQAFLETYFQCLHHFSHDKAKEICDKEREALATQNPTNSSSNLWERFVLNISQLATAEKGYYSLMFICQKWFRQKDSLKTTYSNLAADFTNMKDDKSVLSISDDKNVLSTSQHSTDNLFEHILLHLSGQLSRFLRARERLMDFYENMSSLVSGCHLTYEILLEIITDIISEYQKDFHHPILSSLQSDFSLECDTLSLLLKSQICMSNWHFLNSLLYLEEANTKLNLWSSLLPQKESKKLGFGILRNTPVLVLYQWLIKFKIALLTKFSLYFFEILNKQSPGHEMRTLTSKNSLELYTKISSFYKKTDPCCIMLIYNANGIDNSQIGPGYNHPSKQIEPFKGLENYPMMFLYPSDFDKCEKHRPNIVSLITDNKENEKTIYFYDEKFHSTYYVTGVEEKITLVIIYENLKPEKESNISRFTSDLVSQLRLTKLFSYLKLGIKDK